MNGTVKHYLEQYYSDMNEENQSIIRFLDYVPFQGESALDFSYGGSLMIAAQLSKRIKNIDLSDINEEALHETLQFKQGKGFNWRPVFKQLDIDTKTLIHTIKLIYLARFPASLPKRYDVITCFFALETASDSWRTLMLYYNSLMEHVKPNGWLIIGLVTEPYTTILGTEEKSPLFITRELFLHYFKPDIFEQIKACADWGYRGMLFSAQRNHHSP